jgi:hypothetical protein
MESTWEIPGEHKGIINIITHLLTHMPLKKISESFVVPVDTLFFPEP